MAAHCVTRLESSINVRARSVMCLALAALTATSSCTRTAGPAASTGTATDTVSVAGQTSVSNSMRQGEPIVEPWVAGRFEGIQTGSSHIDEVVTLLGAPVESWSSNPSGSGSRDPDIFVFKRKTRGQELSIEVFVDRHKVVRSIDLEPHFLLLETAKLQFGNRFVDSRYDWCKCEYNGTEGPIYLSVNGSLPYVEYPSLGVYLTPRIDDSTLVQSITYSTERPGLLTMAECLEECRAGAVNQ